MKILVESERNRLLQDLQAADTENVGLDERGMESDAHLIFEALHVLANGIPERLFALLHPCGRYDHPGSNPGRTMLIMQSISSQGARANC